MTEADDDINNGNDMSDDSENDQIVMNMTT